MGRGLADEFLEHGQQLLGIGIFEEDDPDLGAVARLLIEVGGDLCEAGDGGRVAAERDRVRTFDGDD